MTRDDILAELLSSPPTGEEVRRAIAERGAAIGHTNAKRAANEARRGLSEGIQAARAADMGAALSRPDRAHEWWVRVQLWEGDILRADTHNVLGLDEHREVVTVGAARCLGLPGAAGHIAQVLRDWCQVDYEETAAAISSNIPNWRQSLYKYGAVTYRADLGDGLQAIAYITSAEDKTQ